MLKLLFTLCCVCLLSPSGTALNLPKIGVVGGGIGGTSSAFFLKKLFGEMVDITLFERDRIGGRLDLVNIDGKYYEEGGAVIHPRNQHLVNFLKELGLSTRKPVSSKFGMYDGETFVFRESDWHFVTVTEFLWRYGFSFLQLWKDVQSMLEEFSSIYKLQEKEYAFTTVYGMLEYMSPQFRNMTQETLSAFLSKGKFSKYLLEELVQSVMMVNYGQTNNISAFAGFVSLAGGDSNLWSIEGGNKLVPEGLLKKSKAKSVNGDVTEIALLPDGTYSLKYDESSSGTSLEKHFNIIIIAAPFIKGKTNIKFTNFKKDFHQYETEYHRTIATFVKGELNPLAFNSHTIPEEILTFKPNLLFNSIGKVSPVHSDGRKEDSAVYKVFSNQPVSQKNLNIMFKKVEQVKVKDWLAYPHYTPPENLSPFFLYPGLYYVNAIELSASAMEMSSIAGKNVALLAYNLWNNMVDKVDHHKRVYKEEL